MKYTIPPLVGRPSSHASSTLDSYERLMHTRKESTVIVDGESLQIAHVVAVAKYGTKPEIDKSPHIVKRIEASVQLLKRHLDRGDLVYGVNTGYGGSADTRTADVSSLQNALIQHQLCGILTRNDAARDGFELIECHNDSYGDLSMPTSWVKGLMLQRVNSIMRGHSAVSLNVIESIAALLERDITPMAPLRGSISASGDLQPMAYVAGAIQGNPDISVRSGYPPCEMPANEALQQHRLQPVVLDAKEGLGLLNGTSASAAVASLGIYETNQLAVLAQALTAMAVEALNGTAESFSAFTAQVRPHKGQLEAASTIRRFLRGSRLSFGLDAEKDMRVAGLYQDRYPLRTASQWIGPQLEDLLLSTEQISVELNSTTDNPLVDVDADLIHHGGNFQAASITSAMEKARTSIQSLARLLFAQGTQLLNSSLSKGLPPNLAADDPSLSFTCKGIDINLAAYMSEISWLANPVSNHVQSAEVHNQAVNSLALISARYTLQSVEVLGQMCAAYLYVLCQALDLRVLHSQFLKQARQSLHGLLDAALKDGVLGHERFANPDTLQEEAWVALQDKWNASANEDLAPRAASAARAAIMTFSYLIGHSSPVTRVCEQAIDRMLAQTYSGLRAHIFQRHADITPTYLGQASRKLYLFVRQELRVPLCRGLDDCPVYGPRAAGSAEASSRERKVIGSCITRIYKALRSGQLHRPVMEAVKENELSGDLEAECVNGSRESI